MPTPTTGEGRYDQRLTDFAVGHLVQPSDYFVYDKMFPVQPVRFKGGTYPVYERGYFMQDQVAPRPEGGVPREVQFRRGEDSYVLVEEGLRAKTDVQSDANWGLNRRELANSKVRLLANHHKIHNERRFVTEFMDPTKWSVSKSGVASAPGANQFLQHNNANTNLRDFWLREMDQFQKETGAWPNRLLLGRNVYRGYGNNPILEQKFQYTSSDNLDLVRLQGYLEIERVLSPLGVYNAAGGEVFNTTTQRWQVQEDYRRFVGERDALLAYVGDQPMPDYVGAGTHFAWTGRMASPFLTPDELSDSPATVIRGTWDYGEWFDLLQAWAPKVVAPDLGRYYQNVVSAEA